ncbi:2-phospho-L-lactate transferase [Methanobrevibacter cuticularis]|uniref:2-phospho-L-lactate transferase n=1 Tax=Methanobrevibacter cuticularis TaxID=47311 RepID=A0A166DED5_9EURY|nr:2-phospho-L-lactate transferase [Methanobrevibacter cuticularis]KZX15506.1 2-phospho-L-lactate transferase [Methanobrevibacter cuticularis]
MITVLSGGTGTPKLIQGIKRVYDTSKLNIIVNTVENDYFSGVYVAADIDTVLYTLSDLINVETWYGIKDDTFITHEQLAKLGHDELLRIGDKDRGIKIQKTLLMEKYTLTRAVDIQRRKLGIKSKVLPMSDEHSQINIITDLGKLTFHDFLIKHQTKPKVLDIEYTKINPAPDIVETIEESETIIIGPSNPITSILPIVNLEGVEKALKNSYVVAISPIIGNSPVSGPAGKFMAALGYEVSSYGVGLMYKNFLDKFVIDEKDKELKIDIENLIKDVTITQTNMKNIHDKELLAKTVLGEVR